MWFWKIGIIELWSCQIISLNLYDPAFVWFPCYSVLVGWKISQHIDLLRAGWSRDQIPVRVKFSTPVETGPGSHLASCTVGIESFPGVKWSGNDINHPPASAYTVYEDGTDRQCSEMLALNKFKRWGITQKKEYNIQNTPKVWNQG